MSTISFDHKLGDVVTVTSRQGLYPREGAIVEIIHSPAMVFVGVSYPLRKGAPSIHKGFPYEVLHCVLKDRDGIDVQFAATGRSILPAHISLDPQTTKIEGWTRSIEYGAATVRSSAWTGYPSGSAPRP